MEKKDRDRVLREVLSERMLDDLTPENIERWRCEIQTLKEKAEKWDRRAKAGCMCDERYEAEQKLEAIKTQVIEPQLKDSTKYLDTHTQPEPHNIEMSRYWLEKGIYGTVSEIIKILEEP